MILDGTLNVNVSTISVVAPQHQMRFAANVGDRRRLAAQAQNNARQWDITTRSNADDARKIKHRRITDDLPASGRRQQK